MVETLGLDWSEIHVEAEELEHAISEKVLEKLDEFLGRPRFDPHGDYSIKGGSFNSWRRSHCLNLKVRVSESSQS